ncbi:MAG: hypothetical protein BroJett040_23630 [Oligoflexia bacterium]|nr:MAG: hypothetical protein BroJett040_23630 [Oligoflexia bacterium]
MGLYKIIITIIIPILFSACNNSSGGGGGTNVPAKESNPSEGGPRAGGSSETRPPESENIRGACFSEGEYLCTDYIGNGWPAINDLIKEWCTRSRGQFINFCPRENIVGSCLIHTENPNASYVWRHYKITNIDDLKTACAQAKGQWLQ